MPLIGPEESFSTIVRLITSGNLEERASEEELSRCIGNTLDQELFSAYLLAIECKNEKALKIIGKAKSTLKWANIDWNRLYRFVLEKHGDMAEAFRAIVPAGVILSSILDAATIKAGDLKIFNLKCWIN